MGEFRWKVLLFHVERERENVLAGESLGVVPDKLFGGHGCSYCGHAEQCFIDSVLKCFVFGGTGRMSSRVISGQRVGGGDMEGCGAG